MKHYGILEYYSDLCYSTFVENNHIEDEFEDEKQQKRKEIFSLVAELSESQEGFTFPGINPEDYEKLKADRDEDSEYFTPVEELVARFESQGLKVVQGNDPSSINPFILPAQSNDIENDGIYPRYLQITDSMDEGLKRLILLNKK